MATKQSKLGSGIPQCVLRAERAGPSRTEKAYLKGGPPFRMGFPFANEGGTIREWFLHWNMRGDVCESGVAFANGSRTYARTWVAPYLRK
jgi:hypothetical protein